jgi:hypothetical protein
MNDRAPASDGVPVCAHLTQPPAAQYWLDELRLSEFPYWCTLGQDTHRLRKAADDTFFTPQRLWVMKKLMEEHGDTDAVRLNLLLVSAFLGNRRSAAVFDVAEEHLDELSIRLCTDRTGQRDRLALAVLLYAKDPALLMAVDLWDRWHSHRRCVFEIEGHRRRNLSLRDLGWQEMARTALEELRPAEVELRAVLPRRGGREVLLGFRQLGDWSNVRTDSGQVVAGHEDAWTLLLFYDGGNAVDATSSDSRRAGALANTLGGRMWDDQVRYTPVRRVLQKQHMRRLLARLTNPYDHTFGLLEMVAMVPQLPGRPLMSLGNSGQVRIEEALVDMRRAVAFGYEWSDVISVKVGFMDQYRIAIHFPRPGDDLVLTYSDVDRNKDASIAFEQLLADELGVVVKPKVNDSVGRVQRYSARRPRRLLPEHLSKMLEPVLDKPVDWVLEELEHLATDRLVRVERRSVLRCGDASLGASTGGDTLDCPGEVEMPYGTADAERPFEQDLELVCECSVCGRRWYPGRTALPLFLRVRVHLEHQVLWPWMCERMQGRVHLVEEQPGVAMGMWQKERVCLVYLPLVTDVTYLSLGMAAAFPTCWVGQPVPQGYRERGVHLAEMLANGELPVVQAWRMGRDHTLFGKPAPEVPVLAEVPAEPRRSADRRPATRTFTVDDRGIWLDGQAIADSRASGLRMLLALLWEGARADDEAQVPRKLRNVRKLMAMVEVKLRDQVLYTWISRLRDQLEEVVPGEVDTIIVSERGKGYRLGNEVVCVGVELRREEAGFEEAKRRGEV